MGRSTLVFIVEDGKEDFTRVAAAEEEDESVRIKGQTLGEGHRGLACEGCPRVAGRGGGRVEHPGTIDGRGTETRGCVWDSCLVLVRRRVDKAIKVEQGRRAVPY